MIRQACTRLHGARSPGAALARLGGDEFALLLPGADAAAARDAIGGMLADLTRSFELDGFAVHVDASVGVSEFPEHGHVTHDLLKRADVALYCAKARHTPIEVYSPDDDEHSVDRLALAPQSSDRTGVL